MYSYGINGKTLANNTPSNQGAYENAPYLAFFYQQVQYTGLDQNGAAFTSGSSVNGGLYVHNPTGGDGTATVGPPEWGYTFDPATTEIHTLVQWGGSAVQDFLDVGFLTLKQALYDVDQAGIIVGSSASVTNSMTDGLGYVITPAEFNEFVIDLANGVFTSRPT
jgi:hypothetical protein